MTQNKQPQNLRQERGLAIANSFIKFIMTFHTPTFIFSCHLVYSMSSRPISRLELNMQLINISIGGMKTVIAIVNMFVGNNNFITKI